MFQYFIKKKNYTWFKLAALVMTLGHVTQRFDLSYILMVYV